MEDGFVGGEDVVEGLQLVDLGLEGAVGLVQRGLLRAEGAEGGLGLCDLRGGEGDEGLGEEGQEVLLFRIWGNGRCWAGVGWG